MDANYLPFNPNPSKPKFKPPAGAVDTHCHVFGPADVFPYHPSRKYTPCDGPKDKLFALRDFLGFERNVIVTASCHGPDNRSIVDAMIHSDGKAKGIATIEPDITDDELKAMADAGMLGARFNFVPRLADELPHEVYMDIARRIAKLGWHLVVYFEIHEVARLSALPVQIVIDHMAVPDVSKPIDDNPGFAALMDMVGADDKFFVKVTCPERISKLPPPWDDFVPYGQAMVEHIPDRVLWGADWPHPNVKVMPDDGLLVDMIPRIATTPELQHKLLVENPMGLYWS
jgi:2-pyrone-4,6-dicarboxylate lactonase